MSWESGALCNTRSRGRSIAPQAAARRATAWRDGWPRARPSLLASAATLEDVAIALEAGAAIVDLKDPAAGALGAPPLATLGAAAALRDRIDPTRMLSAAIGPAAHQDAIDRARAAARLGFAFVKAGPEGLRDAGAAAARLEAIVRAIEATGAGLVAAAFADAATGTEGAASGAEVAAPGAARAPRAAGAITPEDLPAIAAGAGCAGVLLDTAVKDGRTLLDHLDADRIARFVAAARARGLLVALAGGLGAAEVTRLAALGPDLIGLRGALCVGGRAGRLDGDRVRCFAALLREDRPAATLR